MGNQIHWIKFSKDWIGDDHIFSLVLPVGAANYATMSSVPVGATAMPAPQVGWCLHCAESSLASIKHPFAFVVCSLLTWHSGIPSIRFELRVHECVPGMQPEKRFKLPPPSLFLVLVNGYLSPCHLLELPPNELHELYRRLKWLRRLSRLRLVHSADSWDRCCPHCPCWGGEEDPHSQGLVALCCFLSDYLGCFGLSWYFIGVSLVLLLFIPLFVIEISLFMYAGVMGCGAAEAGFCYHPSCVVSQQRFFFSQKFYKFTSDGMRCHRSDWPGFCLFCCYQPSCVVSQQSWFGLFCFIHFPILPSILLPPPPQSVKRLPRLLKSATRLLRKPATSALRLGCWVFCLGVHSKTGLFS